MTYESHNLKRWNVFNSCRHLCLSLCHLQQSVFAHVRWTLFENEWNWKTTASVVSASAPKQHMFTSKWPLSPLDDVMKIKRQSLHKEEVEVDEWVNRTSDLNRGARRSLPVSNRLSTFVCFNHDCSPSLTVTRCLLLWPCWQRSPNLNKVAIWTQTMIFHLN